MSFTSRLPDPAGEVPRMSQHEWLWRLTLGQMINALNLKLFILQSSGVRGLLKQWECHPQRNFSLSHKEYIFHLDKILSDFPPEPLLLFLPERSMRCSGIILNNCKSDKLSSELVSPVEKSSVCSRCQISQIAERCVACTFQCTGMRMEHQCSEKSASSHQPS